MDLRERLDEAKKQMLPYFKNLTKDPFLADEIFLFVTAQAWYRWPDKSLTELTRLMMTAGRRHYLNHLEKEKNQKRLAIIAGQFKPVPVTQTEIDRCEQLHQCMARLPANWRYVLLRVYFGKQTNAEVAAAMGQSLSAVKNWRRRGILRLRGMLENVSNN